MSKFERKWLIQFRKGNYTVGLSPLGSEYTNKTEVQDTLELSWPLTLEINVDRNIFNKSMSANLAIKGLNENTRNWLYKDVYSWDKYITFDLYAGYDNQLFLIYVGEVRQCYSYKNGGETEFTTLINAFSGFEDWQKGFSSITLSKDANPIDVVDQLFNQMPLVKKGYISNDLLPAKTKRGNALTGNTFDLMSDYLGNKNFVDLGYMHALSDDEYIPFDVYEIDASNKLLGSPKRTVAWIEVPLLFEPRVKIGQLCKLTSQTYPQINGEYKVWGIKHSGVFSGAVDGKVTTNITLNYNLGNLRLVNTPKKDDDTDVDVLARTIYGEARGEGENGMIAVANVVMNRVRRQNYLTGYVYSGNMSSPSIAATCKKSNQFSCWFDTQLPIITSVTTADPTFARCKEIAQMAKSGLLLDITNNADHYHTNYVNPSWSIGKKPVTVIGKHLFYRLT